jgi:hypothetical protein
MSEADLARLDRIATRTWQRTSTIGWGSPTPNSPACPTAPPALPATEPSSPTGPTR